MRPWSASVVSKAASVLGRVGEEGLDVAQHGRAVGLQREEVVAALVEDDLRGGCVGVHRVAGDEEAVERQRLEQRPGGEGLVLALGHRPLGDGNARAAAEGGDDVERRAARGAIEGAAQRLAVDGEHPVAGGAEIVEEDLEGASEGGRIEQAEHAGEGVVAGQAILQAEEFPEQRLAVRGELGEVDAALRAADRGHQRDRQDVEQRVPLGIAPPRVGDLSKGVDQGHVSSSRDTRKNPDQPETEALFFKCDSPGALPGERRPRGARKGLPLGRRLAVGRLCGLPPAAAALAAA